MKIYFELKIRNGLTQIGYLSNNDNFDKFKLPFSLVEYEFAEDFANYVIVANEAARKLNFGYYESVKIIFKE